MAETMTFSSAPDDKLGRYAEVTAQIMAVLEGETNVTAKMATVASLLSHAFPAFSWTGFYVVDPAKPGELVVGPYQGPIGCLRIPVGKGVCGSVAAARETEIVPDVREHRNHIYCDGATLSEIVVPVFDAAGDLIAVLDLDSHDLAAFDETDRAALEPMLRDLFSR